MNGNKIGLVIGTNDYSAPGINKLNFAESDARSMKGILSDSEICDFDEIYEIIDQSYSEATKKIEKIFKDAQSDDFILFYFSGHGKLDMQGDLCLLFKDTDLDYLLSTSLHFDFINRCIEHSKCRTIIMIIDSCFSGAAGMKGDDLLMKSLSEVSGTGRIILSAAKEFEAAKEDDTLKHGVFTNFLMEGLRTGEADTDDDGLVNIDELYDYAYDKTIKGFQQTPTKFGKCEGKIFVGKNPEKIREMEYREKKRILISKTQMGLNFDIYDLSSTVLSKDYEDPESLTDNEKSIKPFLEALIEDKISVRNYIDTVSELQQTHIKQDNIDELDAAARQLYDEEKYDAGIEKWREILNLEPDHVKALKGIRKAERAIQELKKARENIIQLEEAAQRSFNEEKYEEAIEKWREVLKAEPDHVKALEGIGKAERAIKELEEAREKIVELDKAAQRSFDEEKHEEVIEFRKFCSKCGQKNIHEGKYCTSCGSTLEKRKETILESKTEKEEETIMKSTIKNFCPKCGRMNERELEHCTQCGAKLSL